MSSSTPTRAEAAVKDALTALAEERVGLREQLAAITAQEKPLKDALKSLREARGSANGHVPGGDGGTGRRIYRRKRTPMATRKNQILDHLREHGPASQIEIRETLDLASSTTSKALGELRSAGKVERGEPGDEGEAVRWSYKPATVHVGEGVTS